MLQSFITDCNTFACEALLVSPLFSHEFAGREARYPFEEAGEMLWIIESEEARRLADVLPLHQQTLGLIDDIVVDVSDGRSARGLVYDVTEIAW